MSTSSKKANLAIILILLIGLYVPSNVSAAPAGSAAPSASAEAVFAPPKDTGNSPLASVTFNKKAPTSGASVNPSGVKLEWYAATGAFKYKYCYYSYEITNNVCNLDEKSTWLTNGTSTSATLPALSANKTYYWQVGVKLSDGTFVFANGSQSSKWSFKTDLGSAAPPPDKIIYDDTNSGWVYGGTWTAYTGAGPYNNTLHYGTFGSDAQINFKGTGFKLTYAKGANRGLIDVYVDAVFVTTIDAHSTTVAWQQVWSSPTYPAGVHTLRLVHAGGGSFIDVDAVEALGVMPAGIHDDPQSSWLYIGTWTTYSGTDPYNGTLHYSSAPGSEAQTSFDGSRFTLTYVKATTRGSIDVYVDGAYVDTINAHSTTLAWRQTWTSPDFGPGVHTVRFIHAGPVGTYIDIDAIQIFGAPSTVMPGIYDDNNAAWTYTGHWQSYSGTGPYNNTMHYADTLGDTAEITFEGTRFNLTYVRANNRGTLNVIVDANPPIAINANSTTLGWKQVWNSPLYAQGVHTVQIVHAGGGTYIDVDAIEVFGKVPAGTYDDTNPNWTYSGTWTASTLSGPTNNTIHTTTSVISAAEITFEGAQFILTYAKGSDRGTIDVYVDGVGPIATINAHSSTLAWRQSWVSPAYPPGQHTARFVYSGGGTKIDIDGIQILGSPLTLNPGTYDDTHIAWRYSTGWTTFSGTGPANNTLHYTSTPLSEAELMFNGAQFTLTYVKGPNRGSMDVLVDADPPITIDAYSSSLAWKQTWTSPRYTPGVHTVIFRHVSPVGKYIDIDAIQIDTPLDPIEPDAIIDLAAAAGTTGGSIALSWTAPADDNISGAPASSYLVRYSTAAITNETEWDAATPVTTGVPFPRPSGLAEHMTVSGLAPGDTYFFAVRAQDEADNLAALSNSPSAIASAPVPVAVGIYDDANSSWIFLGTWSTYSGTGPYQNTLHFTSTPGSEAQIAFIGSKFTLTYMKASNRSSIDVWVDGVFVNTINAYSATTRWRQTWTSPVYPVGPHTVRFVHAGAPGTYIDIDAIQTFMPVDGIAPATIGDLAAVTGATTGSINLSWTAPGDDNVTGTAASYLVRYSAAAITTELEWGAATPVTTGVPTPHVAGTVEHMTIAGLTPGGTYFFAVRAQDEEPNLGGISNSPSTTAQLVIAVPLGTYDDANVNWSYIGTWSSYSGAGPAGNTLHYTSTAGSEADMTFNGSRFTLTYVKGSNRGLIQVIVDGNPPITINAYSATTMWQQTWTSPTYPAGVHTVRFVHGGGGTYIDIDAIVISGAPPTVPAGNYDDLHAGWSYIGDWTVFSGSGPVANSLHYSATPASEAQITFNGTRFTLSYTAASNRGLIDVWVDGVYVTTINAYSSTTAWQSAWTSPVYPAGVHTIRFIHMGGGTYIDIDAIEILP